MLFIKFYFQNYEDFFHCALTLYIDSKDLLFLYKLRCFHLGNKIELCLLANAFRENLLFKFRSTMQSFTQSNNDLGHKQYISSFFTSMALFLHEKSCQLCAFFLLSWPPSFKFLSSVFSVLKFCLSQCSLNHLRNFL